MQNDLHQEERTLQQSCKKQEEEQQIAHVLRDYCIVYYKHECADTSWFLTLFFIYK